MGGLTGISGAFSLGKPMWNCLCLIRLFSYSKGIDMPHWRKANPPLPSSKQSQGAVPSRYRS